MDTSNIFLSYGKHSKVELIHGRLNLLEKNEVVIPNKLYQFLENKAIIKIPLIDVEGNSIVRDFKIVGVVEDIIFADKDDTAYWPTIILPRDIVYDYDLDIVNRHILIRSANPLYTNKLAHSLGHASNTTYRLHSEANKEISMQILLKGFALAILFVLLSINLYSSFSNALSDRRFEIGVKRAIGASKKHIIWQFFFEGMIVMIVDIIISIYLVFNIVLFYKLYKLIRFDYQWTIYINKFSLVAFVFVTLFLSNIFSLIFAFKSTQVEIVDHLKLE